MKITKTLSLALSPCPNDTFIFYDLIHNQTNGLKIEPHFFDIKELNLKAFNRKFDVTKISCYASSKVLEDYVILRSGAALGYNCGPLLLAKQQKTLVENATVAIPGKWTTANFLLKSCFPTKFKTVVMPFDKIMPALAKGKVEYGVVIHESRFTYSQYGLCLVEDLGKLWQDKFSMLLPLGVIVVKRSLGPKIISQIEQSLFSSVNYALENFEKIYSFVQKYAKEMAPEVIKSHIDLYVNKQTQWLDTQGKKALLFMLQNAIKSHQTPIKWENAIWEEDECI